MLLYQNIKKHFFKNNIYIKADVIYHQNQIFISSQWKRYWFILDDSKNNFFKGKLFKYISKAVLLLVLKIMLLIFFE